MIRFAKIKDCKQIAKIHVDTWKSAYKGIISDDILNHLSYDKSQKMFEDIIENHINQHLVVEVNHQVVGFASFGKERTGNYPYKGEIQAIYILKVYQKKGFGQKLVKTVAANLIKQDINTMMIWALKDNPYIGFYKKLGGELIDTKDINIKGYPYKEIAFAWDDLSIFINK